tara:strand:+ start:4039 stop:4245 length:207 start_codon:yes stop_codon:yes gene_type:complete
MTTYYEKNKARILKNLKETRRLYTPEQKQRQRMYYKKYYDKNKASYKFRKEKVKEYKVEIRTIILTFD